MPDAYNPWGAPVFPTADDNAMQPETFVPQGVRDWTQQAAPKDYNILSQIAGSLGKALMYPGQVAQSKEPISTEDMVAPAFNLASMLTLGAGAAPQEANALNMGIKAYHGSPHDFDKFDLSKIGTGEGAQAYGHGLYFAENPEVASQYSRVVTANQPGWNGLKPPAFDALPPTELEKIPDEMRGRLVASWQNNGEEVAKNLSRRMFEESRGTPYSDALHTLANTEWKPPGHRYEVNINADPSHFLDWDKPLSQQSPHVQDILQNDLYLGLIPKETGRDAYNQARPLSASEDMARPLASQKLREAGIPGIKYLDEGSRNPWDVRQNQKGFYAAENLGPGYGGRRSDEYFPTHEAAQQWADRQQTRNYVVFNHDLIDIMRKYAVPGMLGAPILANALSEQKT